MWSRAKRGSVILQRFLPGGSIVVNNFKSFFRDSAQMSLDGNGDYHFRGCTLPRKCSNELESTRSEKVSFSSVWDRPKCGLE